MKISKFVIILSLCLGCSSKKVEEIDKNKIGTSKYILKSEFQAILDSSEVKGGILIYDLKEDTYYSNNFESSHKGNLPASTFKIATVSYTHLTLPTICSV